MRFSPFNPISFRSTDAQSPGGCRYVPTFAESDRIMMQAYHSEAESVPSIEIVDCSDESSIATVGWTRYMMNMSEVCSIALISGLPVGLYSFRCGLNVSDRFSVASMDGLEGTVLLQYAQTDNMERRDIVNLFNGSILYYEVRLPGGFKDSGWRFGVDNECFGTQSADQVELSAIDYTDKTLTIGRSDGIDADTAEFLNRILSCPLLFVDGTRYARPDSSMLDKVSEAGKERFVYSVLLREAMFLNPTWEHLIRTNLRRTPDAVRMTDQTLRRIS